MITRRMLLSVIVAASTGLSAVLPAMSQSYPTRPITMIVPFPAGGALDTVARVLSERMRTSLGQPVIIERANRFRAGLSDRDPTDADRRQKDSAD